MVAGEFQLFDWLVDRFDPWLMLGATTRHRQLREDARSQVSVEDLVQEAWLRAFQHVSGATKMDPLGESYTRAMLAFFGTLLRNVSVDAVRRVTRSPVVEHRASTAQSPSSGPSVKAERKERSLALRQALLSLSRVDQALLVGYLMDEVPLHQVAAEQGITADAASKHVQRALKDLRKRFPDLAPFEFGES